MKKLILALLIFGLFVGQGLATTYYMRADGEAANKAAATACGAVGTAMNMTVFNGETFAADDIIYMCDDGGVYRAQMTVPSSGSVGQPITIAAASGDSPIISGADVDDKVTDWTGPDGNGEYTKAFANDPNLIFGDGALLTEGTVGSLGVEEWGYSGGSLYLGQDPATYATLEIPVREYAVRIDQDYITFIGISGTKTYNDIWSIANTHTGIIFSEIEGSYTANAAGDCITQHNATAETVINDSDFHNCTRGITFTGTSTATINRSIIYSNGVGVASDTGTYVFNDCDLYGNIAQNIRQTSTATQTFNSTIIRDAGTIGIWPSNGTINLNHCIIKENGSQGIYSSGSSAMNIFNNTIYNNGNVDAWFNAGTILFKNNIVSNEDSTLLRKDAGSDLTSDYNLFYRDDSAISWNYEDTTYTLPNFADWKTASSQDANSPTPADPLFTNAATGDFTLQAISPAINTGVNLGAPYDDGLLPGSIWPDGVLTGPCGNGCDIGAYEFPQWMID